MKSTGCFSDGVGRIVCRIPPVKRFSFARHLFCLPIPESAVRLEAGVSHWRSSRVCGGKKRSLSEGVETL